MTQTYVLTKPRCFKCFNKWLKKAPPFLSFSQGQGMLTSMIKDLMQFLISPTHVLNTNCVTACLMINKVSASARRPPLVETGTHHPKTPNVSPPNSPKLCGLWGVV